MTDSKFFGAQRIIDEASFIMRDTQRWRCNILISSLLAASCIASLLLGLVPTVLGASGLEPSTCLRNTFSSGPQDRRVFSQYGEDGIIESIFNCIGTTTKTYVEASR